LLYRDSKTDATVLEELRDELRRRRTTSAKELLRAVEEELRGLAGKQPNLLNREKAVGDHGGLHNRGSTEETGAPALGPRETAAQKRIADLRMRLLDLSNANRLLNYKFSNRSRRQVRLVDKLPDQLISKLQDGKRLVFRSLPEPDDVPEDEKSDRFLLALEEARRSDEEYLAAIKNLGDNGEDDTAHPIERALRERLRKTLGLPERRLRDQIGKEEWARRNGIDPSSTFQSLHTNWKTRISTETYRPSYCLMN
jgi:hypothetical protein